MFQCLLYADGNYKFSNEFLYQVAVETDPQRLLKFADSKDGISLADRIKHTGKVSIICFTLSPSFIPAHFLHLNLV